MPISIKDSLSKKKKKNTKVFIENERRSENVLKMSELIVNQFRAHVVVSKLNRHLFVLYSKYGYRLFLSVFPLFLINICLNM